MSTHTRDNPTHADGRLGFTEPSLVAVVSSRPLARLSSTFSRQRRRPTGHPPTRQGVTKRRAVGRVCYRDYYRGGDDDEDLDVLVNMQQ